MIFLANWRTKKPVPMVYRRNFFHLYMDIAWYGVLSGSAIAFAGVFATRLGASAVQIGLLNAGPAIVSLLFTLPAGQWLNRHPVQQSVFWTAVFHRLFYFFWILLPWVLPPTGQIWGLIMLTLLMSVPGTGLAVGFNALFAGAVPVNWRSHVAGIRNALLALTYIVVSLVSGWLLNILPFPVGYQVIFGIGFFGAVMSTFHLWFIHSHESTGETTRFRHHTLASPGLMRTSGDGLRAAIGLRFIRIGGGVQELLQIRVLRGRYGYLMLALFAFHFTQFLAIPLFPLYWVNQLLLTDQQIGWGTALFYGTVFMGSTQLVRLTNWLGNYRLVVLGAALMSFYPALTALTQSLPMYLITSVFGGMAWSLIGNVMANYLLEQIPDGERPSHLAWYNLALNGGILLGSMSGPLLSQQWGIVPALLLIACGRYLAAVALWWQGKGLVDS